MAHTSRHAIRHPYEKLKELSRERLLGDHVPYVVEAYPEGGKRHLSAESGLYCRVMTDGLLNLQLDEKGAKFKPVWPEEIKSVRIKRIFLNGEYRDIKMDVDAEA